MSVYQMGMKALNEPRVLLSFTVIVLCPRDRKGGSGKGGPVHKVSLQGDIFRVITSVK